MTRRALYVLASPLILLGNIAAAVGDAVLSYPEEWLAAWRWFGRKSVPLPLPDEYEFLTFGVVDHCTPCGGSGFAPDAKDLDGDPACRDCGGSGEVVRVKIQKGTK